RYWPSLGTKGIDGHAGDCRPSGRGRHARRYAPILRASPPSSRIQHASVATNATLTAFQPFGGTTTASLGSARYRRSCAPATARRAVTSASEAPAFRYLSSTTNPVCAAGWLRLGTSTRSLYPKASSTSLQAKNTSESDR